MGDQPCGCACRHTVGQHLNGACLPCEDPSADAQREQEAEYWREQEAKSEAAEENVAASGTGMDAESSSTDQPPRSERLFGSSSRRQRHDPAVALTTSSQPPDAALRQICGQRVAATGDVCLLAAGHRGRHRSRLPR